MNNKTFFILSCINFFSAGSGVTRQLVREKENDPKRLNRGKILTIVRYRSFEISDIYKVGKLRTFASPGREAVAAIIATMTNPSLLLKAPAIGATVTILKQLGGNLHLSYVVALLPRTPWEHYKTVRNATGRRG